MDTTLLVPILLTALASALATAGLAWLLFRMVFARALQQALDEAEDRLEQRVKAGVLAAGEELLPALREQVKLGFQDALRDSETGELVENTASAVNLGTEMIGRRLGSLFGLKPRK